MHNQTCLTLCRIRIKPFTCHQPRIHTVSELRCMYECTYSPCTVQMQVNLNTHMQDLEADTFAHQLINNSIRQTWQQPNWTSLWEFCKQVSRQWDLFFLFVCHGFTINSFVYVYMLCLLVKGWRWRSYKPDDVQKLCSALTAHGCDSGGCSHHGNQCWFELKYTLFPPRNCPICHLLFPGRLPSTTQGLSLRHLCCQSSPTSLSPSDQFSWCWLRQPK